MMKQFERVKTILDLSVLQNSHITIIGLGGVGSIAAESLARTGIGNLTLVDFDVVELSNLNRQILALHSTIGKKKTLALKERLIDINPDLKVNTFDIKADKTNFKKIIDDADFVIDAIDLFREKIDLIEFLYKNKIPFISSMGTANRTNPLKFGIVDISKSKIDPLARKVRKELKKRDIVKGFDVVISFELPKKQKKLGSVMFVTSIAGLLLSYYAVEYLLGKKENE